MPATALDAWSSFALVAGSMVGIGIFLAPPVVAQGVQQPLLFLFLWLAGGVVSICGALSLAELGAMMPRAGGDYPYLRRAYGPGVAFAAGWLQLLAIFPGSLATLAVGTATFQIPLLMPGVMEGVSPQWVAVGIVIALTLLNHLGVVLSGRFQMGLSLVPIAALMVAACVSLFGDGIVSQAPGLAPELGLVAAAFLPVYFAYSGWNAALYVGGEIRTPAKNLPRSLIGGTGMVMVLYVLLNLGYLHVIPIAELGTVGDAGAAAAGRIWGPDGQRILTVLVLFALFGCLNGAVLAGSRIAYAMAADGQVPRAAGRLHPRFKTPVVALWGQAAWSIVLIASSRFEELMTYTAAAMLLTGTLTVMTVVVLRRKLPDLPRPYRVGAYPLPPLLYSLTSVGILVVLGLDGDISVVIGVVWFLVALGAHRVLGLDRSERTE